MVRLSMFAAFCCAITLTSSAFAGWGYGSSGGSSGSYGSYYGGSSGGSSGSYVASYGSSGGSSGSYVTSYGSSGGSSGTAYYGSSGVAAGPGPLRRFAAHVHDSVHALHDRVHARHAYYGSYGSSGSYAGYGSSGGSSGYYRSGYGSSGSTYYGSSGSTTVTGYGSSGGSSGGAVSYGSTGSTYSSGYLGVSKATPAPAVGLVSNQTVVEDAVFLNVTVPAAAKVFVNGAATTSTGTVRQFVSRGLVPGKNYKFEIRAEMTDAAGKLVEETKTVMASAGQRDDVQFTMAGTQAALQTTVTLHVPENAEVTLAGNKTSASGATRTFRTAQLKAGERWDDYVVEVRVGSNVKRESLRLLAGDDIQMSFNFDDSKDLVASR
ncbi:MAG: TIGR03000 domain-containing protein [Pirellulales bacterium]